VGGGFMKKFLLVAIKFSAFFFIVKFLIKKLNPKNMLYVLNRLHGLGLYAHPATEEDYTRVRTRGKEFSMAYQKLYLTKQPLIEKFKTIKDFINLMARPHPEPPTYPDINDKPDKE